MDKIFHKLKSGVLTQRKMFYLPQFTPATNCRGFLRSSIKISIIIPTKNEETNIARCLKSINFCEVIVVDNASTDKTCEITKSLGAKVFTYGPERSSQRNFGAQKANTDILFFVDADMEIGKAVVKEALLLLDKNKNIQAIIVPEKSKGSGYWAKVRSLERKCYLKEPAIEAARIFRKEAFEKVGGFDKELFAAEDWDLTLRIKKIGKIGRISDSILHHEELTLIKHLKKKYYYSKNIMHYASKHPASFKNQASVYRILIFARHWKELVNDPLHAAGVIFLKFLEYLVFLFAKI